jgi:hypothetical protein
MWIRLPVLQRFILDLIMSISIYKIILSIHTQIIKHLRDYLDIWKACKFLAVYRLTELALLLSVLMKFDRTFSVKKVTKTKLRFAMGSSWLDDALDWAKDRNLDKIIDIF